MKRVATRIAVRNWTCSVFCLVASSVWAADPIVSPTIEIVALSQKRPQRVMIDGICHAVPASSVAPIRSLSVSDSGVRFCNEQRQCDAREVLEVRCRDVLKIQVPNVAPRQYGHRLRVRNQDGTLRLLATLHMESYVAGVVGAELGASPLAAQDAQAILVRTFAMGALEQHRHADAPLCDLTHCQVFSGTITGAGWRAAKRTWGSYLVTPAGKPAHVYFHSTCGGSTISAHEAWPGGPPTDIVPIRDVDASGRPYCADSPYLHWSLELPAAQVRVVLQKLLQRDLDTTSIVILPRDEEGLKFDIGDQQGVVHIAGSKLLRAFGQEIGWYKMKSSRFRVTRQPDTFRFTGEGLGHRVGLCQYGAMRRAQHGASAQDILAAYFPKLHLVKSAHP